jgi:hypothetical protein
MQGEPQPSSQDTERKGSDRNLESPEGGDTLTTENRSEEIKAAQGQSAEGGDTERPFASVPFGWLIELEDAVTRDLRANHPQTLFARGAAHKGGSLDEIRQEIKRQREESLERLPAPRGAEQERAICDGCAEYEDECRCAAEERSRRFLRDHETRMARVDEAIAEHGAEGDEEPPSEQIAPVDRTEEALRKRIAEADEQINGLYAALDTANARAEEAEVRRGSWQNTAELTAKRAEQAEAELAEARRALREIERITKVEWGRHQYAEDVLHDLDEIHGLARSALAEGSRDG